MHRNVSEDDADEGDDEEAEEEEEDEEGALNFEDGVI